MFRLHHACAVLVQAFGCRTYLVGSSLERRDFRDVDVRTILDDADFDRMFPGIVGNNPERSALWSLVCTLIALYLSEASGLPVDYQIQRQTNANEEHKGRRNALGIFYASEMNDAR
jgi:hypothetical protein